MAQVKMSRREMMYVHSFYIKHKYLPDFYTKKRRLMVEQQNNQEVVQEPGSERSVQEPGSERSVQEPGMSGLEPLRR